MAAGGKLELIAYKRGYENAGAMMRELFTKHQGVVMAIAKDLGVARNSVIHWRENNATFDGTRWVLKPAATEVQSQPIPNSYA